MRRMRRMLSDDGIDTWQPESLFILPTSPSLVNPFIFKTNLHHSFKDIANTIVVGTLYTNYIIGESGDVTVNVSLHNHILIVYTLICD